MKAKLFVVLALVLAILTLSLGLTSCDSAPNGIFGGENEECSHEWGNWVETTKGVYKKVCALCGADEEKIRSIVSAEIVGGKLKYTYSDGTSELVEVGGSEVCEHNDYQMLEVVEHTQTENGTYIYVCNLCGNATAKNEIKHTIVTTVVAATCVEKGYSLDTCHCGYTSEKNYSGELAEHTWSEAKIVNDAGKTICEDGGTLYQYCSYCKLTNQMELEPTGCVVEEWKAPVVAEDYVYATNDAPILEGQCVQCACICIMELPAFDEEGYELEVTVAKTDCSDANGKGEFTYTVAETNQEFTFVAKLAATVHVLNGAPVSESMIVVNGNVYLDYTVGNVGILAGQVLVCEAPLDAYYTCEVCNKAAIASAYRCHQGVAIAGAVATGTCVVSGTISIEECTLCGEGKGDVTVLATVPATGHNYAYGYTTEIVDDEVVVTSIYKTCVNKVGTTPCDDIEIIDCIDGAVSVIKPSTCKELGEAELTYRLPCYNTLVNINVPTLYSQHKLNGEFVDTKEKQDSTLAGINLFASEDLHVCEEVAHGFFMCDICENAVSVDVVKEHQVVSWEMDVEPTCCTVGIQVGYCTLCSMTVHKSVDALDEHQYIYEFVDLGGGEYEMTRYCESCGSLDNFIVCDVAVRITYSTCFEAGTKTYMYKDIDGRIIQFEVKLALAPHTLNGKRDDGTAFDYDTTPGLNLCAGTVLVCGGTASGYYVCDVCSGAVPCEIVRNHSGAWTWEVEPDCYSEGIKTMEKCIYCAVENISSYVDPLGHEYVYKFNAIIDDYGDLVGVVELVCNACGDEVGMSDIQSAFGYLNLKDATSIVKPTCKSAGSATFEIEVLNNDVVEYYTIYAVIPQIAHTRQKDLKSTSNIFVASRVLDDGSLLYYAIYECETCGEFFVLDSVSASGDRGLVEAEICELKVYLAEKEAAEAD